MLKSTISLAGFIYYKNFLQSELIVIKYLFDFHNIYDDRFIFYKDFI